MVFQQSQYKRRQQDKVGEELCLNLPYLVQSIEKVMEVVSECFILHAPRQPFGLEERSPEMRLAKGDGDEHARRVQHTVRLREQSSHSLCDFGLWAPLIVTVHKQYILRQQGQKSIKS